MIFKDAPMHRYFPSYWEAVVWTLRLLGIVNLLDIKSARHFSNALLLMLQVKLWTINVQFQCIWIPQKILYKGYKRCPRKIPVGPPQPENNDVHILAKYQKRGGTSFKVVLGVERESLMARTQYSALCSQQRCNRDSVIAVGGAFLWRRFIHFCILYLYFCIFVFL